MANHPKLRFNEFTEPWTKTSLGGLSVAIQSGKSKGRSESGAFPLYGSTGAIGFTDIPEYSGEAILIARVGANAGAKYLVNGRYSVTDNTLIVNLNNNQSYKFFSNLLEWKKLNKLAFGSGQPLITGTILKNLEINVPDLLEQEKIASFLSAVDQKISLLTQKHELLTTYKKGVMQKIFNQEVRFKDEAGNDYPDWESKTISELCECLDSKRKPLNETERQLMKGDIPYWGANNIMDYVNDFIFDETIVLLAEDGGNFNEYQSRPIANISFGKSWVNNHTHVLRGKPKILNEFLFYSLVHKNITAYVTGGTRSKLTKNAMLKIKIDLPSLSEQRKIASFLSALDNKIGSIQKQFDLTKQYKQGLLQQMFI